MKIRYLLPFILFVIVVVLLWRGLALNPRKVPSPFINQAAPTFEIPMLYYPNKLTSNKDFFGHITLLNIWASWCQACQEEHAVLVELAKNEYLTLYGLNYKDDPVQAKAYLAQYGNPYKIVGVDRTGKIAIDWGVYGTPETFIIDKNGMIRYKQIGPITFEVWNQVLKPIVNRLKDEKAS